MKIDFITHGNFIVRLSEIKYCELLEKDVVVYINREGKESTYTMKYASEYSAKDAFIKLTIDCDAYYMDCSWKHPLVNQVIMMRQRTSSIEDELKKLTKAFALLRKELKKNSAR